MSSQESMWEVIQALQLHAEITESEPPEALPDVQAEIDRLEAEVHDRVNQLVRLRQQLKPIEVPEYRFTTLDGERSLLELFGDREQLMVIHNMGQSCPFCTLWADGLNPFLPHLEALFAVVLVSKDSPEIQRRTALARHWNFRLASHGGGTYIQEQSVMPDEQNAPGIVLYQREGDKVLRKTSSAFGPGDLYCSLWHLLGLAGIPADQWAPRNSYL